MSPGDKNLHEHLQMMGRVFILIETLLPIIQNMFSVDGTLNYLHLFSYMSVLWYVFGCMFVCSFVCMCLHACPEVHFLYVCMSMYVVCLSLCTYQYAGEFASSLFVQNIFLYQ